jgi:hypothetical protein
MREAWPGNSKAEDRRPKEGRSPTAEGKTGPWRRPAALGFRPSHLARLAAALLAVLLAMPCAAAPPPTVPDGHRDPVPGEHPRLLVRKDGVAALRAAARTDWGRRVADRIRQALKLTEKLAIAGRNREVIKEAGFKAAGYGAVHLLDGEAATPDAARAIVLREVVAYPLPATLSVMDRVSRLHGTALAYDLCYDAWDEGVRTKVRAWLLKEARLLPREVGPADAAAADQPEHVTAWASAGLAELAALGEAEDPAARDRIAASERAVLGYLDRSIGQFGFDFHGESVRQAALASGILPFVRAERLVLGRDHTAHPAIGDTFLPLLYQWVPDVGMAVTGAPTATVDRSGLFALAADLAPTARRPAVRWLFDQLEGQTYLGIIRPHQGLSMLTSGLEAVAPAPPDDSWPRFVRSDRAGTAVFRTRWKDADDVVAVLHHGALRLVGLGATWASHAGPHAPQWSHDPGAGRMDNVYLFRPTLLRETVHRTRVSAVRMASTVDEKAGLASVTTTLTGRLERVDAEISVTENEGRQKVTRRVAVPEGGPFEWTRTVGVDCTGRSGAAALVAVADRLTGGGRAPRVWVLHVNLLAKIAIEGDAFTVQEGDASLHGTAVYPPGAAFAKTDNRHVACFVSAEPGSDRFEVVLTLQRGQPPPVTAGPDGLAGGVSVGGRTLRLDDGAIRFGP